MKSIRLILAAFLALAVMAIGAPQLVAQTPSTGALTGTVTDPSGAVIANATVTLTNTGTGQTRTTTTDANGSYKFGLLAPGTYSVAFTASGFQNSTVPSVTVNVTETEVLNRSLAVGTTSTQVTVEATAEAIQTQNATNGGLVGSQEVTSLPLVSRNYTQIINLSPGVVSNVTSASSVGNGTVDVAANGARQNQNNYSMDGSSVVNYVSGAAAQDGSYPGIAIPNPDTIQEFKVQTSQYDASSGRNPGANVEVVTKSGTNSFHGDVWEFNRNNLFNANDFYYKYTELNTLKTPNKPQTLKQNTFGFTFGGPIKKDKLFFFGSYQGIRQINGIGTSGFASGYAPNTHLLPWNDPSDPTDPRHLKGPASGPGSYRAYLGSVFGGTPFVTCDPFFVNPPTLPLCNMGLGTSETVAPDGSNISNTAIAMLQAPGLLKGGYNQGFYFPGAPASCNGAPTTDKGCVVAISDPIRANENQYMINTDYVLSQKNTLSEKYFFQDDPQFQPFNCFINAGNCNPGAPINAHYTNHVGLLKLTSVLSGNFVNEARFSFHRDVENNTDPNTLGACSFSTTGNIIPLVNNGVSCPLNTAQPTFGPLAKRFPELGLVPMLDILGILDNSGPWSQGGNFSMISSNFINTFQWGDQISWNHGKHALRAGVEVEHIQYNNTIPAAGRGELLFYNTADFLTSSSGSFAQDPNYDDGTPQTPNGGIVVGFGLKGALTHYNRINAFDWYVQDDIKVSPKLTLNLGLRWEYDGFPSDISGQFANVWASQLALNNTGSFFLNQPIDPNTATAFAGPHPDGTLVGFVVPSNFNKSGFSLNGPQGQTGVLVNKNQTLVPGTPLDNFAPRLGLAWQPLSDRFVVRAGYGWFYDRIYGNLLIDNQLNLPPYSGSGPGPFPANLGNTLHDPFYAGAGPLAWTPRYIYCSNGSSIGPSACATNGTFVSSGLGYTSDSNQMADRLPLTQEYNLDLQYEFARGWTADIGYVGSHGIHLYNWSQVINLARLVSNAPNNPTGGPSAGMIASSLPFNDPANTTPVTVNTVSNVNERVAYLGFSPGGVATTNTNGDSLYDSLQAELKHQFSKGLLLQVAYTWSKGVTNVDSAEAGSGINPPGVVYYGASNSNNPLDLRQQYGLAAFNRPQRVVVSYVYDIPHRGAGGITGKLLSGWTISGVTTIQDGLPFTISDSNGGSIFYGGTGSANSRAALKNPVDCNAATGNCKSSVSLVSSGSTTDRAMPGSNWLNTSAFISMSSITASSPYCIGGVPNSGGSATAPCGSAGSTFVGAGTGFGNSGIGVISGPGQFNFDMALVKNTQLWEHGTLQFRIESFNLWNHPQFDPPFGNNVSAPSTFGKITETSVTPRVFQFGLKLMF